MRTLSLTVLILAAACGGSSPAPVAPAPPAPVAPVESPVETPASSDTSGVLAASALAEQYEVGKKVYTDKKCDTCHEADGAGNPKNPPVIGPAALPEKAPKGAKKRKAVAFVTAADVVGFVHTQMPIDKPGTLSDDEAYAVTAWMLDASKVPLAAKLDATTAPTIKLR